LGAKPPFTTAFGGKAPIYNCVWGQSPHLQLCSGAKPPIGRIFEKQKFET
jgi:hypothetical protein